MIEPRVTYHATDFAYILGVLDAKSEQNRDLTDLLMKTADMVEQGLDSFTMQETIDSYRSGQEEARRTDHRRTLLNYVRILRELLSPDDERNDSRYWKRVTSAAQGIVADETAAKLASAKWLQTIGVPGVYDVWMNPRGEDELIFPLDNTKADYTYLLTRASRIASVL